MPTWKEELTSVLFWRAVTAETLGSFMLIFFCCASGTGWQDAPPTIVQLSLTAGLNVATIIWCIHGVSGAHINPALTLPLFLTRKVSLVRATMYMLGHFVGAMIAAVLLQALTPEKFRGTLALNMLHPDVSPVAGLVMEALMTFVLVFTVFATIDKKRSDLTGLKGSGPLAIGLSAAMVHLAGIKFTGCSLNPARTLAPAILVGIWDHHWVYWCGPLLGGSVAGLLYEYVYAANASIVKKEIDEPSRYSTNKERQALDVGETEACM